MDNSPSVLTLAILKRDTAGALAAINESLKAGHDLNVPDAMGRTALIEAIVFEEYEVAARLVDLQVDVTIVDAYKKDALDYICDRNIPGLHDRMIVIYDLQIGQENRAR
ncbi:ankyrin repeat protein [Bradyrhizobium sp. USDA 4501]